MRVKPATGLSIRHPQSKELLGDGDEIEVPDNDLFWAKLLDQGDVVRVDEDAGA